MESPKILILEDEGPIRAMLAAKFNAEGFMTIVAATGEEALQLIPKEKPDVIMTDVVMYPMDGLTFLKKLRGSNLAGAHTPCFILSNQNDPDTVTQLKSIGISDYIDKAGTPLDEVVKKIRKSIAH